MTRLLVDGVFFQFNNTGIARLWRTLLAEIARRGDLEIHFLDRGNAPAIDGVHLVPFRRSSMEQTAEDAAAIEDVCRQRGIDAFTSTFYTTPLGTPMVLMVYDMIPELFRFAPGIAAWAGKGLAISYAQRYLCISNRTRDDLLSFYPEIPPDQATTAYCGLDHAVFRPQAPAAIDGFRRRYALDRPYYLMVGTRGTDKGFYKNGWLMFKAVAESGDADFDVVCVGGEPRFDPALVESLPRGVRCLRLALTDEELACAYGGALALVYPSLYEGFGLPVVEAMASSCPVITTRHGSLAEAAGDAACLMGGLSPGALGAALKRIREPAYANDLRARGLRQAQRFTWDSMAGAFSREVGNLLEEHRGGAYDDFLREWRKLRMPAGYAKGMPP